MPQQVLCPKHQIKLESDGICQKCVLERSKESAEQFPEFAKLITKRSSENKNEENKEEL